MTPLSCRACRRWASSERPSPDMVEGRGLWGGLSGGAGLLLGPATDLKMEGAAPECCGAGAMSPTPRLCTLSRSAARPRWRLSDGGQCGVRRAGGPGLPLPECLCSATNAVGGAAGGGTSTGGDGTCLPAGGRSAAAASWSAIALCRSCLHTGLNRFLQKLYTSSSGSCKRECGTFQCRLQDCRAQPVQACSAPGGIGAQPEWWLRMCAVPWNSPSSRC